MQRNDKYRSHSHGYSREERKDGDWDRAYVWT